MSEQTKIDWFRVISYGIISLFLGLFVGAAFLSFVQMVAPKAPEIVFTLTAWVGIISTFVLGVYLGYRMKKVLPDQATIDQTPLTAKEKWFLWAFCAINPIVTGAVAYFIWHKEHPKKANQANKISFIVFFIYCLVFAVRLYITLQAK